MHLHRAAQQSSQRPSGNALDASPERASPSTEPSGCSGRCTDRTDIGRRRRRRHSADRPVSTHPPPGKRPAPSCKRFQFIVFIFLKHVSVISSLDASSLPARKRSTSVADDCLVATLQLLQVRDQSTRLEHRVVAFAIHFPAKENVLPNGAGEDPRVLTGVRYRAADGYRAGDQRNLAKNRLQKRRFPGAHGPDDADQRTSWELNTDVAQNWRFLCFNVLFLRVCIRFPLSRYICQRNYSVL